MPPTPPLFADDGVLGATHGNISIVPRNANITTNALTDIIYTAFGYLLG